MSNELMTENGECVQSVLVFGIGIGGRVGCGPSSRWRNEHQHIFNELTWTKRRIANNSFQVKKNFLDNDFDIRPSEPVNNKMTKFPCDLAEKRNWIRPGSDW